MLAWLPDLENQCRLGDNKHFSFSLSVSRWFHLLMQLVWHPLSWIQDEILDLGNYEPALAKVTGLLTQSPSYLVDVQLPYITSRVHPGVLKTYLFTGVSSWRPVEPNLSVFCSTATSKLEEKRAHLQVALLTWEQWSNFCGFLCKSCWGLWNDCGGSVRMVLNRALQALQLELQNGSDLISLGKQWQFLSLNLWNFYTEVAFCGSSGASQSPSCLSLLPFPLFPTSLVPGWGATA